MFIKYAEIHGLPAVDISTGSKVGKVRTFSVTYDMAIKGLLVERSNDLMVLIEPGHILSVGSAAAVIDLDEKAPVVSQEEGGNSSIIGRPAITLSGDPAGKLINCTIDLELMEVSEVRLLAVDEKTEVTLRPEQVRTLGHDYVILAQDALTNLHGQDESLPVPAAEFVHAPAVSTVEEVPLVSAATAAVSAILPVPAAEFVPVPAVSTVEEVPLVSAATAAVSAILPPEADLLPDPAEMPDETGIKSPAIESVPATSEDDRTVRDDKIQELEDPVQAMHELPVPSEWQDQIDTLVNKSLERTMVIDNGGEQRTLQEGTVITREIAEEIATNAPLFLEVLPLFVK
ncbi:MAG: hypothetical protein GX838_02090 [Clostridiaceae bacterium]|nr:hypothetical protein [Clostridiaceae bacterium]